MKDDSSFLVEKKFNNTEGCSMKFTNEDHLTVPKKRYDMILNLGLGQKGTTFTDQTPTPTQFIRNCEEVGLFQDLQNVNPFEETFKKAAEAVKSGQLSLEKSFQSTPPDDTLHTPNVFPHITDVPNINISDSCNKSVSVPHSEEELLKEHVSESIKNSSLDIATVQHITHPGPVQTNEGAAPNNFPRESKVILNIPEGHLVQLLPPDDLLSSSNVVVIKNTVQKSFSPSTAALVKEKIKENLNKKKNGKNLQHKVPILKCPTKKVPNSLSNKFSKFSKNALKLISKLENSGGNEVAEQTLRKPKKANRVQSKESRSEFLARSRAASSRCREKKKIYLLYLEKVNSELSAANQNLILMNSLLRQEINDLHRELLKHKNCTAADKNTETEWSATANLEEKSAPEVSKFSEAPPPPANQAVAEVEVGTETATLDYSQDQQSDPTFLYFDVAEVILNDKPEESEIPLNEDTKTPDIIVRFNSVGNDFSAMLPADSHVDRFIETAGYEVKQIYGEHSYYLRKCSVDIDKRMMRYKAFKETLETPISPEECKKFSAFKIQMKQDEAFRDLSSLKSKVLIEPRTPPPLILLKPFKKRSLQNKRNEKR